VQSTVKNIAVIKNSIGERTIPPANADEKCDGFESELPAKFAGNPT
jgi:hypothetical protein